MTNDILGREVTVGDIVVSYNLLYTVLELTNSGVRCILYNKSKTTRPTRKYSREIFLVDKEDILAWELKHGY